MKKILLSILALGLTASFGFATTGLVNSKHNMSSSSTNTVTSNSNQLCVYCHTPHFATPSASAAGSEAIWNHTMSSATYTWRPGMGPAAGNLNKGTALCLSCHDGTIALGDVKNTGSFAGNVEPTFSGTDVNGSGMISNTVPYNIGTDFTDDHPVERMWNMTTNTKTNRVISSDGMSAKFYPTGTTTGDYLTLYAEGTSGQVYLQCMSCHDVHNAKGYANLLNMDNQNQSALCQSCHSK